MSARYVIHGTSLDNLEQILKKGVLETNPKNAQKFLDKEHFDPKQIFTQILFNDLPDEENQRPHWFSVGIVLDKRILKDKKWYATGIGGFLEKFTDAFKDKDTCKGKDKDNTKINILAKNELRPGQAARIPSLSKLKKHISARLEKGGLNDVEFMHSHEVLFGEDISLEEYGVGIMIVEWVYNKILTKAQQDKMNARCKELGIPIILYNGTRRLIKPLGINNAIELIDCTTK